MLVQNVPPLNVLLSKTFFLQNILPQNDHPQNVLSYKTSLATKRPPIQNVLYYKTSLTAKHPPAPNQI